MEDLENAMNQFAAERYAQRLCIRYVSGPRNQKLFSIQQVPRTLQPSELTIGAYCSFRMGRDSRETNGDHFSSFFGAKLSLNPVGVGAAGTVFGAITKFHNVLPIFFNFEGGGSRFVLGWCP
jgi:hypothetical protein